MHQITLAVDGLIEPAHQYARSGRITFEYANGQVAEHGIRGTHHISIAGAITVHLSQHVILKLCVACRVSRVAGCMFPLSTTVFVNIRIGCFDPCC